MKITPQKIGCTKSLLSFLILAIFAIQISWAQVTSPVIKGYVLNEDGLPVIGANILLSDSLNNIFFKSLSDSKGAFSISVTPIIRLKIAVTALGFKDTVLIIPFVENNRSVNINVLLRREQKMLNTVTISGGASLFAFESDKTVINVSKTINGIGTNAFELLQKAPSIRTNAQEELVVNGKNGLNLYLDGKSLNLTGQDIGLYLKSLQSAEIETIEIITNPSAKYDASGNAGIINIKLKRDKGLGSNYSITLNANFSQYRPKYNPLINYNYRSRKINFLANYNLSLGDYKIVKYNYRKQQDYNQKIIAYDQDFEGFTHRVTNNLRLGLDYIINANNSIGLGISSSLSASDIDNSSFTSVSEYLKTLQYNLTTLTGSREKPQRIDYTAYYLHKDSSGNELSISGGFRTFNASIDNSQQNIYQYVSFDNKNSLNSKSQSNINVSSLQVDYTKDVLKGKFSSGVKIILSSSKNNLSYFDIVNTTAIDTIRSNRFNYRELTYAAYVDYTRSLKKFNYRVGLRVESIDSRGYLYSVDNKTLQSNNIYRLNFFPNVNLVYQLTDENNVTFNYTSRIDRPEYRILNPFVVVQDDLFYQKGNPFLLPQFTDEYKISHVLGQRIINSFSYSKIKNYFLSYRDTVGGTKSYETRINLDHRKLFMLSSSIQNVPFKWWKNNLNISAYHEEVVGDAGNNVINVKQNSLNISSFNSLTPLKNWTFEISGTFNSRFLDAPAIVKQQWFVDVGFQRKVSQNGSIKISVTDVFNTFRYDFYRDFGGLAYQSGFKTETQQFRIAFILKFGNQNVKDVSLKDKGADEANKRLR